MAKGEGGEKGSGVGTDEDLTRSPIFCFLAGRIVVDVGVAAREAVSGCHARPRATGEAATASISSVGRLLADRVARAVMVGGGAAAVAGWRVLLVRLEGVMARSASGSAWISASASASPAAGRRRQLSSAT